MESLRLTLRLWAPLFDRKRDNELNSICKLAPWFKILFRNDNVNRKNEKLGIGRAQMGV
jgi:hypothetical protein